MIDIISLIGLIEDLFKFQLMYLQPFFIISSEYESHGAITNIVYLFLSNSLIKFLLKFHTYHELLDKNIKSIFLVKDYSKLFNKIMNSRAIKNKHCYKYLLSNRLSFLLI